MDPRAGLDGRKISPPPGLDPRTVQPVASRYTDYATRVMDSSLFIREDPIGSRKFPAISLSSVVAVSTAMAWKSVRCLSAQSGVRTRGTERLFLEDTNLLICKIYAVQELNKERLILKEMKSKTFDFYKRWGGGGG